MGDKEIVKEYKNGDLTVVWQPNKCIHSAKCVHGLPEVFDPNKKPWIDVRQASQRNLMDVIDKCPSGALSYRLEGAETESAKTEETEEMTTLNVNCFDAGPLSVPGPIKLMYKGKEEVLTAKSIAFCRCGATHNKPFCDGSHRKIGFED